MRRPVKAPGPAPKATASSATFFPESFCSIGRASSEWRLPGAALEAGDFAVEPERDRAPLGGGFDRRESHARF